MTDRIELRGLRVLAICGALPEEKYRPQPLEIDLVVEVDLTKPGRTDALVDTVDYGALARAVATVAEEGRFTLLEHLAQRIADEVSTDPRIESVTVAVHKVRPPTPVHLASAGVRIQRRTAHHHPQGAAGAGAGVPSEVGGAIAHNSHVPVAPAPSPVTPAPVAAAPVAATPAPSPVTPAPVAAAPPDDAAASAAASAQTAVVESPGRSVAQDLAEIAAAEGGGPRRRAFLGLGSNIGDRAAHLRQALDTLPHVKAVSRVYETEPLGGPPGQDLYLNLVVELDTDLSPRGLLKVAQRLEEAAGRRPAERHAPRPLDVDVLLVGDLVVDEADLVVPHPRMHERRFVLRPLADLAPELVPEGWEAKATGAIRRLGTL